MLNVKSLSQKLVALWTKTHNVQKGFTLIEITVVISILTVLTTFGIASFVNYSRNQTLQTAALEFGTTLNLAKSRSFSQVKPSECSNQALDGYEVLVFEEGENGWKYRLQAACAGNIYLVREASFPQDITVSGGTTSTSFFFPIISGGVIGAGSVVLAGYGNTRTITVDQTGTIKQ